MAGLSNIPKKEWSKKPIKTGEKPIDRLKPDSDEHKRVLDYLLDRISLAENEIQKFHSRWRVSERKYQGYISLPDWERQLKEMNDKGEPPKVVSIQVPYVFATVSTIVTYLIHTFAGRKPMFQVSSNKKEMARAAATMELKLQYDADHTRLIKHLYQFLQDGQIYGVGILRCNWKKEKKKRTRWVQATDPFGMEIDKRVPKREMAVTYEGNDIASIDPYAFLPDPRVPMSEVNSSGEFVFWKATEGLHKLYKQQRQGNVKWIDAIKPKADPFGAFMSESNSDRSLVSGGTDLLNSSPSGKASVRSAIEIHQGTCEIIPAELGLGDSMEVEKWIFTIANKNQIIQAEPFDADHDKHPVVVTEPYTMGYSFGQVGMADYLNQIQDGLSWLINSHMDNVRVALNNMFVIDPSKVEIQDLKKPGAGKLIRLKRSAYGQPIGDAIKQMQVYDVTTNHVKDFQLFMGIGDTLSSITDNMRGMQDSGGRKTATEVRTAGEASASRLAAQSRIISAQAIVDLTEMMSLNNQQYLSDEFLIEVAGQDGIDNIIEIRASMLTGDFHFPIHDGTLPLDRVALLDVWKEILQGVATDQQLRQSFSLPKLFEFVAELGGAKNIEQFKIEAQSPEEIQQAVQAGNAITPDQAMDMAKPAMGINANQGSRVIE